MTEWKKMTDSEKAESRKKDMELRDFIHERAEYWNKVEPVRK